jgi:hypothetical protein
LAEGAVIQNIDFTLPLGAVITGRVLDEAGEAVPHASVSLLRPRFIEGRRRWVVQNGSSTDDRGEFRIFGVAQGDYIVRAAFDTIEFGSRDRVRYVPTYYPGTPVASGAQRLTIGLGQEVNGIIIALARAATATVRGTLRLSGGASPGTFAFVSAQEVDAAQPEGRSATGISGNDGTFAIPGLLPGSYLLEARLMTESEFGSTEVVVGGTDVSGVSLVLSKGTTARGRIRFDTGDPPQGLRPSQVFLIPTFLNDRIGHIEMSGERPAVRDDWSFEVPGLRGEGFIYAGTLGDWQMKRVRREGIDVTDTPLDFAVDVNELEIELTTRTTTVSGGVSDDRGRVALDATVIVFADDPRKWGPRSRFVQSARPDQQGRFTIKGLPPGKYVAIAVDLLEPGEERDPELLAGWRPRGMGFTLADGETHTVDLKLSGS